MTTYEDAHETATTAAVARRFARAAGTMGGRMIAAVRRHAKAAADERRLREMPDYMLKDIGLHRSEIPAMVRMGRAGYGH